MTEGSIDMSGRLEAQSKRIARYLLSGVLALLATAKPGSASDAPGSRPLDPPKSLRIRLVGHNERATLRPHWIAQASAAQIQPAPPHCVPKNPAAPRRIPAAQNSRDTSAPAIPTVPPASPESRPAATNKSPGEAPALNPFSSDSAIPADSSQSRSSSTPAASTIRDRLKYMQELLERQRQQRLAQERKSPGDGSDVAETATDGEGETGSAKTGSTNPDTDSEEKSAGSRPTGLPVVVTESPVNRLKLADSLFGAGDTELAQRIYEKIPLSEMPPDERAWVQFQLASCHRRLGRTGDAEKLYRVVASYSENSPLSETSRWWLDRIHARRKLTTSLQQINDTLARLEAATNAQ